MAPLLLLLCLCTPGGRAATVSPLYARGYTLLPAPQKVELGGNDFRFTQTAGFTLAHPAACALIREKSRRAMERLTQFKPYVVTGPVEVKVEFTPKGTPPFEPREGVRQVNERTWTFRGKDIIEAWLKYSSF